LDLLRRQGLTPPDLENIDLDDSATYRLLASGDTTGVFQLESSGMKDLLVRLRPGCFATWWRWWPLPPRTHGKAA